MSVSAVPSPVLPSAKSMRQYNDVLIDATVPETYYLERRASLPAEHSVEKPVESFQKASRRDIHRIL